jgi:hypothetical protein
MGKDDHYVFMDGCIVKGCRPAIDFERTFGEYAALLERLYTKGRWGRSERTILGLAFPRNRRFNDWVQDHVHLAQSTQNMRTGAYRVDEILRGIGGHDNIHLFGSSAAGAAILEYFLLTDPDTLYYNVRDPDNRLRPTGKYRIDNRVASLTTIDAPTNWIHVRHDEGRILPYFGRGAMGRYLVAHTRIKAGPHIPQDKHTTRLEDVPNTWVEARPVAGLDYDNRPHYSYLPEAGIKRHMYTGSHMSKETAEFLMRVWR